MRYKLLRLFLFIAACGWGMSFFFTLTPWEISHGQLQAMGLQPIAYQGLLNYWLKMASAAFGLIGMLFFMLCIRPQRFPGILPYVGGFQLCVGIALLLSALSNDLSVSAHPTFIPDILFCMLTGIGIVFTYKSAAEAQGEPEL